MASNKNYSYQSQATLCDGSTYYNPNNAKACNIYPRSTAKTDDQIFYPPNSTVIGDKQCIYPGKSFQPIAPFIPIINKKMPGMQLANKL
jgi:hypothetical protein